MDTVLGCLAGEAVIFLLAAMYFDQVLVNMRAGRSHVGVYVNFLLVLGFLSLCKCFCLY